MFGGEDGVEEVGRGVGGFMRMESIYEFKMILKSYILWIRSTERRCLEMKFFMSIPLSLRRCFMKAISSNFSSYVRIRSVSRHYRRS